MTRKPSPNLLALAEPRFPLDLRSRIYVLRGLHVIFDKDLADLYRVAPIRLRQQVKRNPARFPSDFMFKLTDVEAEAMVSQNVIPSRKALGGALPYAFTEQGVASLSGVLTGPRAIEVYLGIMRAFVEMRRMVQVNAGIVQRLDGVERRQAIFETDTERRFDQVLKALEGPNTNPRQGVFYEGKIHDAYSFASSLIREAQKSIVLIDNFVDDTVLTMLGKRVDGASATIYTRSITPALSLDIKKHNSQYPAIEVREFVGAHDRFLILDETTVYHIGASLKDLGKKWFAFSRFEKEAIRMLEKLPQAAAK